MWRRTKAPRSGAASPSADVRSNVRDGSGIVTRPPGHDGAGPPPLSLGLRASPAHSGGARLSPSASRRLRAAHAALRVQEPPPTFQRRLSRAVRWPERFWGELLL